MADKVQIEKKNRIKFLTKQRKFDIAIEELETYLEEYPSDHYMHAYKALLYHKIGDKKTAAEIASKIVESVYIDNNVKSFAYETLARIATTEGDKEQAIVLWEQCIELSTLEVSSKALANLSRLYNQTGQRAKALEILEPKDGNNSMALNVARAYIYYPDGNWEQVLTELNRPVKADDSKEKDGTAYANRYFLEGLVLQKQNQLEDSIPLYKKALTCVDNKKSMYWDTEYQLASVYYQLGYDELMISICEEIIKTCAKPTIVAGARILYANNYVRRCNLDAAKKMYDTLESDIEKSIGYAKIEIANYNFDKALEILNGIDTDDENRIYNINVQYAMIMYRHNKYDEFMKYYDKIINSKYNNNHTDSYIDIMRMRLSLELKNNLPPLAKKLKYCDKQILAYDEQRAIYHIIEKHVDKKDESFDNGSDIRSLYYHISENLDNPKNKMFCDGLYDKYIVNLQETGYEEKNVRFVTVVCLADTYNIITMYPTNRYTGVFNNEPAVKPVQKTRLSAIDKFNKKYGL